MDETARGGWRGGLRKRLVNGAFLSSSAAPVAKADDVPPPPLSPIVLACGLGVRFCLLKLLPPSFCSRLLLSQRTRGGIVVGEGVDCNSTAYRALSVELQGR